jgi:hypothetical protein
MLKLRVTCPTCGTVSLIPGDFEVLVDRWGTTAPAYAFRCPGCSCSIHTPCDTRTSRLLIFHGATMRELRRPAGERRLQDDVRHAPPFTADDVARFRRLLLDDRWLEGVLDGGSG